MDERNLPAKVPQVTLLFWIIKILATTLGETISFVLQSDAGCASGVGGVELNSMATIMNSGNK